MGFKERAEARRSKVTVNKVGLHSKEHHSFHLDTDGDTLSRLIFDMSHAEVDSCRVDKTQVKIIKLKDQ